MKLCIFAMGCETNWVGGLGYGTGWVWNETYAYLQAAGEGEEVHSTTLEVSKFIRDPAGSEFKSQGLEFVPRLQRYPESVAGLYALYTDW